MMQTANAPICTEAKQASNDNSKLDFLSSNEMALHKQIYFNRTFSNCLFSVRPDIGVTYFIAHFGLEADLRRCSTQILA
jgi:hypothetical protein